jgi:Tfp pilus assembly PilM family ATPase
MARTLLAIHRREAGVHFVQAECAWRSCRLVKTHFEPVSAGSTDAAGPVAMAQLVRRTVESHGLMAQGYALCLGAQFALMRRLVFPFGSSQKIRQVLGFEMESVLPVKAEDQAMDFCTAWPAESGTRSVIAAAFPTETLSAYREAFADEDLPLELVDLDLRALAQAGGSLAAETPRDLVLLDVGLRHTKLVCLRDGAPMVMRSLGLGALDMLATLGISGVEEAGSIDFSRLRESRPEAAARLDALLHRLGQDIARSLAGADIPALEDDTVQPELLVPTGLVADWLGFATRLSKLWEVPVLPAAELAFTELEVEAGSGVGGMAACVGTLLNLAGKGEGFDLLGRRSEQTGLRRAALTHAKLWGAAAAVALLAFGGATLTDIMIQRERLAELDSRIESTFEEAAPGAAGNYVPSQYASILRARLGDGGGDAPVGTTPETAVVELMRTLAEAFGASGASVEQLNVGGESVRLNAHAADFAAVEAIKNRLEREPGFAEVAIRGAAATEDGVRFSLSIRRRGFEEAAS